MPRMVAPRMVARGVRAAAQCRRVVRRLALAALVAVAPLPAARADTPPSTLVLQLDGPAQFEFAGYFAALWKGFYDEAGLIVEIRPGSAPGRTPIDPAHEVAGGRAQFGTGSMQLVIRTAQGLPLLLLAPIFQASGAAVYYRAGTDFGSPGALLKGKIGRLPATDIRDLELATALRGDGIDPGKIRSVPLDPSQAVAALADRTVDAVAGSAWDFPWQAHARNLALKSFNPADYRVEFYGDTLFTLARFERANPALVRRFRDASLKGWAYALDHVDEIAGRLATQLPPPGIADPAGFARYQAGIAQALSRHPAIALGHSSPERWSRIEASLVDAGALVRTADPDSFVYDPQAEARHRTDWHDGAILAATALAIVAITAALLWRRRRPMPAPSMLSLSAAAAPATIAAGIGAEPPPPAPDPASIEPAPAAPTTTDLNALLTALEPAIRKRVPSRIGFRLSLFAELWACKTDGEAVAALVASLVGAATAALKPDDTLIVGTRNAAFDAASIDDYPGARIGEFARITVRDSGPGFSAERLDRLFDPTATASPAVAAAWPAMRKLGGFARAESAEGVGTAIHLYFPRVAAAAAADPAEASARRYRASGSRATQRRSRSLR